MTLNPLLPSSSLQTAQLWKEGQRLRIGSSDCAGRKKNPQPPKGTKIKTKHLTRVWANRTHKPSLLRPAILGFPLLITFTSGSYFPFRLPEVHSSRFSIWFSEGKRKPRLVAFAHFRGVNTSTVTDFESLMIPWSAELDRDGNNWLVSCSELAPGQDCHVITLTS